MVALRWLSLAQSTFLTSVCHCLAQAKQCTAVPPSGFFEAGFFEAGFLEAG